MAKEPSVWVTALISPKKMFTVERDLLKHRAKYKGIIAYIPTVKVLSKQVKNRKVYDTLPMMFNYGFFKVPKYYIPNYKFLESLKKDMECIMQWVKDPCITREQGYFTMDKLYNPLSIAIVSVKEINSMKTHESQKTFYTDRDIDSLKPGSIVTLHIYPWEGLPAEIIAVNKEQKYISVRLLLGTSLSLMKIGFENVLYSIYRDVYTENSMSEESLDDIKSRHKGIENSIEGKNARTKQGGLGHFEF